jgi:polyhydroxyalkanoate synthesis regulator phasin
VASKHNLLRFGSEDEVAAIVDEHELTADETRAVLLNLLQAMQRQEKARAKLEARLNAAIDRIIILEESAEAQIHVNEAASKVFGSLEQVLEAQLQERRQRNGWTPPAGGEA